MVSTIANDTVMGWLTMRKKKQEPTTLIQNCNFQGSDSAGVLALARALEANARAIEALAKRVETNSPLLNIGSNG